MKGHAVEYIYSELQVVESCDDPANKEMNGRHVVAIRLNLGDGTPSGVLIVCMAQALALHNDLTRIFREHAEITADEDDPAA